MQGLISLLLTDFRELQETTHAKCCKAETYNIFSIMKIACPSQ